MAKQDAFGAEKSGSLGSSTSEPREEPLDPGLPIIDPHHHLQDRAAGRFRPARRYLLPELLEDVDCGHNIRATVVVESSAMYKVDGPLELRPVGETEFVNGVAAISASGRYGPQRLCAGIVGFADMRLGERARPIIEAHIAAGGGRFRGVRNQACWDEYDGLKNLRGLNAPHALLDPALRQGVACLASFGLPFETHCHSPQLGDVIDLARALPQANIILDHTGGPVHTGPYASRRAEMFQHWKSSMRKLAQHGNVVVKLGALGRAGDETAEIDAAGQTMSERLARMWRPYVETAIDLFGPRRCMFESNFPPEKRICAYGVLWNAFKRIAAQYTVEDRNALFRESAAAAYHLPSF